MLDDLTRTERYWLLSLLVRWRRQNQTAAWPAALRIRHYGNPRITEPQIIGREIAGEVATSINTLIEAGKRFVIFDIDQWISFGDPLELRVYEYWEDHFHARRAA